MRPPGNDGVTLRATVKRSLADVGLLEPGRQLRDKLRAITWLPHNRRYLSRAGSDGLPIPPARLRLLTTASPSIEWFMESGRAGADAIRNLLAEHDLLLSRQARLLDFGCGCGRVLRHWARDGINVDGCDYNPELIGWCRDRLPFATVDTNQLEPPLPYDQARFDLVYALSVFTHLPEPLQRPWAEELARVTVPGGHLIVSTHGAAYRGALTLDERAHYDAGHLVVKNAAEPGSNRCGVYASPDAVRQTFSPWFMVRAHVPQGASGNPPQDLVLLRRTPTEAAAPKDRPA